MGRVVPEGLLSAVVEILRAQAAPIRRRKLLEELERKGHRVSLAGLNRVLQIAVEEGRVRDSPGGLTLAPAATVGP